MGGVGSVCTELTVWEGKTMKTAVKHCVSSAYQIGTGGGVEGRRGLAPPPIRPGPGSVASASLSARCFEPPAKKGRQHAVLLSDSEVGTGSEHRDHAALIFIRHELADLFGRQSLHKRLNLRVLFMSLTGGHHHGIGARLTLKIDRVRHRV